MYPAVVAERLRARGHDVQAVTARAELRALPDLELFDAARAERRTVVTENIADFVRIVDGLDQRGETHPGLVLVEPGKFPRGQPRTIGRLVTALERLLRAHPADETESSRRWL